MSSIKSQTWKGIKWLVWKSASLAGNQWGDRFWTMYSLARIFISGKILRTFVNEPEGELLRKIIKKNQVCFDIGASVGTYTYLFSSLVGSNGQVYSFEPLQKSFSVLQKTVKVFHLNNVVCHAVSLGDRVALVEFIGGTGRPGNTYLAHIRGVNENNVADFQMVTMTTLDTIVSEQGIRQVDFIKCDVEGAELLVFRAGKNTLRRHRPIVMCELSQTAMSRYNSSTDDIFSIFNELDYQSFAWLESNLASINHRIHETYNYIFLPRERVNEVFGDLQHKY